MEHPSAGERVPGVGGVAGAAAQRLGRRSVSPVPALVVMPTPRGQDGRGVRFDQRNTPRVTIRAAAQNRDSPCRPAMGPRCGWSTGSSRSSWWTAVAVRVCLFCVDQSWPYTCRALVQELSCTVLLTAIMGQHCPRYLRRVKFLLPRSPHKPLGPCQQQPLTGAHERRYHKNKNDLRTLTIPRHSLQFYTKRCTNQRWPTRPDRAP